MIHAYLLIAQYTTSTNKFHSWNVAPHNLKITVKNIYNIFLNKKIKISNVRKNNLEKKLLYLDSRKIKKLLKWKPILNYPEMIYDVDSWYGIFYSKKNS